jgi:hypothetical protein
MRMRELIEELSKKSTVKIPSYLKTPKLKPYIEQGLITQEIVDLYAEAFATMNRYLDIGSERKKALIELGIGLGSVYSNPVTAKMADQQSKAYERVEQIYNELLQAVREVPTAMGKDSFPYLGYRGYNEPDDMGRRFAEEIMKNLMRSRRKQK